MNFKFAHNNINVLNLDESLAFYQEALGLKEVSRKVAEDGSFILVYLGDTSTKHQLELTWLRNRHDPYDLGDNEMHIAFTTSDFDAAHEKHKEMGASAMKIKRWACISSVTRTATGWKLFQKNVNYFCFINYSPNLTEKRDLLAGPSF